MEVDLFSNPNTFCNNYIRLRKKKTSASGTVFSCEVLRIFKVAIFLFVKISFSVLCIRGKLIKRKFKLIKLKLGISEVIASRSWLQQLLRKIDCLQCQSGVMISGSL